MSKGFVLQDGKDGRMINNIPPTQAALSKHRLWASYNACHVWGQCFARFQTLTRADLWRWKYENNMLTPDWTDLPEPSRAVWELLKCECKVIKNCRGRCKCIVGKYHVKTRSWWQLKRLSSKPTDCTREIKITN